MVRLTSLDPSDVTAEAGYDALLVGLELLAKEHESPNG